MLGNVHHQRADVEVIVLNALAFAMSQHTPRQDDNVVPCPWRARPLCFVVSGIADRLLNVTNKVYLPGNFQISFLCFFLFPAIDRNEKMVRKMLLVMLMEQNLTDKKHR